MSGPKRGEGSASSPPATGRATYLALPSRDLGFLKNTLRLYLREDKVAEVVQAFGARCGAGQVIQSQVEIRETKDLAEVVPAMCAQIGLAKIRTRSHGEDHLTLELSRIAEASPKTSRETRMEFTRGFLVGAVSELLQRRVLGKITPETDGSGRALVELRWNVPGGPSDLSGEGAPTAVAGVGGSVAPAPAGPLVKGAGRAPARWPSGAFLLEEDKRLNALSVFSEEARSRGGLAITSDRGKDLRSRRDLSHVRVYDLSPGESLGLLSLEAGNLPALLSTVDEFVKRVPAGVILLTDLPMLLQANGVEPTRNFISIVAELLSEGKGTLLAAAPAGSLAPGDRSLLLRTLKVHSKSD